MFEQGKRMLAKALIVYALAIQVFSFSNVAATIAQAPTIKESKQGKKVKKQGKKQSRKQIIRKLKMKLAYHKKRVLKQKMAMLTAGKKARNYKKRIKKSRTETAKQKLAEARSKALKAYREHRRKFKFSKHKASVYAKRLVRYLPKLRVKKVLVGKASWYGGRWAGRRTATGERFNPNALTAAMRDFRGRKVKVVNMSNKKTVMVRINDHGPARWTGRIIDLSATSFSRLASTRQGVIGHVKIYVY